MYNSIYYIFDLSKILILFVLGLQWISKYLMEKHSIDSKWLIYNIKTVLHSINKRQ